MGITDDHSSVTQDGGHVLWLQCILALGRLVVHFDWLSTTVSVLSTLRRQRTLLVFDPPPQVLLHSDHLPTDHSGGQGCSLQCLVRSGGLSWGLQYIFLTLVLSSFLTHFTSDLLIPVIKKFKNKKKLSFYPLSHRWE